MALLKRDHGIEVKSASSTIEEVVGRQFVERLARQRGITLPSGDLFAEGAAARPAPRSRRWQEGRAGAGQARRADARTAASDQGRQGGSRGRARGRGRRRPRRTAGRRDDSSHPSPRPVETAPDAVDIPNEPVVEAAGRRGRAPFGAGRRRVDRARSRRTRDRRSHRNACVSGARRPGAGPCRRFEAAPSRRGSRRHDRSVAAAGRAAPADHSAARAGQAGRCRRQARHRGTRSPHADADRAPPRPGTLPPAPGRARRSAAELSASASWRPAPAAVAARAHAAPGQPGYGQRPGMPPRRACRASVREAPASRAATGRRSTTAAVQFGPPHVVAAHATASMPHGDRAAAHHQARSRSPRA